MISSIYSIDPSISTESSTPRDESNKTRELGDLNDPAMVCTIVAALADVEHSTALDAAIRSQ
jgi:hypothetical protein